jgi:hypothetical protein
MPIYSYACVCGWHADLRGSWSTKSVSCSNCKRDVRRAEVNTVGVAGFARTPPDQRDWIDDFKQFREASIDLEGREADASKREGVPIQGPNLARAASMRAKELLSKGVKDVNDLS